MTRSSIASACGSRRGSRNTPPPRAASPRRTSGSPNRAPLPAVTRSQQSTISNPPPSAHPSTAAISGLAGGRSTMPAKPRDGSLTCSPAANALRSIPAQKAAPAPCSTPTRSSDELSSRSSARAMPADTAPFTALRCCGRLMVTIRTPFSRRTRTSSDAAAWPAADDMGGRAPGGGEESICITNIVRLVSGGKRAQRRAEWPSSALPRCRIWIWLVPSGIVASRASRKYRSTGDSSISPAPPCSCSASVAARPADSPQ